MPIASRVRVMTFATVALMAATAPHSSAAAQSRPAPATAAPRTLGAGANAASALRVDVHPGMELLAIMAYLGQQYPTPLDSRYKSEVWTYFLNYRKHPALDSVRSRALFADITELGLLLHGSPLTTGPLPDTSSWYGVYGRGRVAAILRGAEQFARDTKFDAFHRAHAAEYRSWARQVEATLASGTVLRQVEQFYHDSTAPGAGAAVQLYLEPLNNWGAHQIDLTRLRGSPHDYVVRFQFGPSGDAQLPDSPLTFTMGLREIATVWHEVGHAFLRPLMAEQASRIASLSRLFDSTNTSLRRQNIVTWHYAFEENLVRAVVAVLVGAARGEPALEAELRMQTADGFTLVPTIARLLQREYVPNRATYPTLAHFAPRLLDVLRAEPSP